jgi:hypothetical protein
MTRMTTLDTNNVVERLSGWPAFWQRVREATKDDLRLLREASLTKEGK